MLEYITSLSNQYRIGELLYEEVMKKGIYTNVSKEEYRKKKHDDGYITDVYKAFRINTKKYDKFLDICSNPNTHTLHILKNNNKIQGKGVSLPVEKKGYPPNPKIFNYSDRYGITYMDLLNDDLDAVKYDVDYVIGDCFPKHNMTDKSSNKDIDDLNDKLQENTIKLMSKSLKLGGDAMILLPFRFNPIVFFNVLFILKKMFTKVGLFKSEKYTPGLAVVYIFCTNKTCNYDPSFFMAFDRDFVKNNIRYLNYVFEKINIGIIKGIRD